MYQRLNVSVNYPSPDKKRRTKKVGKVIARLDSMPKIAFTVIDTIRTPRRPSESPRPPHRYPPIIIPNIWRFSIIYSFIRLTD